MDKKKIKVLVATNLYALEPVPYASHLDMFCQFGKHSDEMEVTFFGPWRMPIDRARNDAARMAQIYDADFLFFFDDDMYFGDATVPYKLIKKVAENDKINVLQALAFIRGYPFKPMSFKLKQVEEQLRMTVDDTPEELLADVDSDGLVKRDAVGCCATVIRRKVFDSLPMPWFLTGSHNTEDIFFCAKLGHYFKDAGIYVDTTMEVGHMLDRPILSSSSRKMLLEMHEHYKVDQVWLPDETFMDRLRVGRNNFEFETRINPLEVDIPLRKD
jgi:hypothetical protein